MAVLGENKHRAQFDDGDDCAVPESLPGTLRVTAVEFPGPRLRMSLEHGDRPSSGER